MTPRTSERRLRFASPFAADPLMAFLGDRAIPGVEAWDGTTFHRSVRLPSGDAAVIGLTPRPGSHVALRISTADPAHASHLAATARRLLDLDADPTEIDRALADDAVLAPLIRATPGLRLPGTADGFELLVRAILGQQVSVRAARTFAGRIVETIGTPLERPTGGVTHLFPTAERMADDPLVSIGLTTARAATLHRVATLVATGDLDLSVTADRAATAGRLSEVPGIGPWTVAYVSMRALRDSDAFPAGDLGVRMGFETLGLPTSPAAMRDHAERWRPWRAYAVMHLWHGAHRAAPGRS